MKRKILITAGLVLVAAMAVAALFTRPAYCRYKEERALRQAKAFLEEGDLTSASLSVRQALVTNPRSLAASRLMADMAEAAGSPQMLDWRRRMVELAPTIENRLSLAAAALRTEAPPYSLGSEILTELRATATNRVAYCNLSADLAMKLGKPNEAETWVETARQLQPSNSLHELNLAVLRLGSTNRPDATQARATLMQLRTNTNLAAVALRSLVADSLLRKDLAEAETFSAQLLTQPVASFADRLQHLDILGQANSSKFQTFLPVIQSEASTNAAKVSDISNWMLRHGLAERARQWLASCPPAVQVAQPGPLVTVECLFTLHDWAGAEKLLGERKWDEFEPMRLALLSRAAFELRDSSAADLRWRLAVRQARGRLGTLMWLTARADEWRRDEARIDLLWEITRQFPAEGWALRELRRYYLSGGNTRGLNRVYEQMSAQSTGGLGAKNDFALTSLLLKTNQARAHEVASELYAEFTGEPSIVSTWAYSLHLQGHTGDGLEVLEKLDDTILSRPDIALYYGALLRSNGQIPKAHQYLKLAQSAVLLPEERELLKTCQETSPMENEK